MLVKDITGYTANNIEISIIDSKTTRVLDQYKNMDMITTYNNYTVKDCNIYRDKVEIYIDRKEDVTKPITLRDMTNVLDLDLPVWLNIDGEHSFYYESVAEVEDRIKGYEVEYITKDSQGITTIEVI